MQELTIEEVNEVLDEVKEGRNNVRNIRVNTGMTDVRTRIALNRLLKDGIVKLTNKGYVVKDKYKGKSYVSKR